MKKYVNGKLYEMTEADKINREKRLNRRQKRSSDIETENRIKELEKTIELLLDKQNESEK